MAYLTFRILEIRRKELFSATSRSLISGMGTIDLENRRYNLVSTIGGEGDKARKTQRDTERHRETQRERHHQIDRPVFLL